jgi:hypothetical protein
MTAKPMAPSARLDPSLSAGSRHVAAGRLEEQQRIRAGWQCPECYGARIQARTSPFQPNNGFLCVECGCQWSSR